MAKRIRAHVRWLEKEVSRTDRELDEAIGEREAWARNEALLRRDFVAGWPNTRSGWRT